MASQAISPSPAPDPGADSRPISEAYRRYVLGLLLGVYVLNFVDRQILSILLEPIKAEIELDDFELGLLGGIAFAVFYTFLGIPVAAWADRGSRRTIIALALFVWSSMTALTGLARSFSTLFLARVGVGIGEAGCSPPAHSLISDYFRPERRATALAIYAFGIPIGAAIGTLSGGWIGEYFGWRAAFLVVGLPGLLLSLVVRATLREPPRGHSEGLAQGEPEPIAAVLRFLLRLRSFWHLSLAAALHAFVGYGAALFLPSFFIRVHGFGLAEIATWLALLGLVGGVSGTYLGGKLADRFGQSDGRWYLWVPGIATVLGAPAAALFYLWPQPYWALLLALPAVTLAPMYLGPTFAVTQGLVKPRMRAMASAVLLFILNLIGLGLGPSFVGYLSRALEPTYGADSIRFALLWVVTLGNAWSALHYFLGARTLREDMLAKELL